MSRLRGYRVGGTLHIIVNNQVGFTTDPIDARSTHYASDLAKGFEMPIAARERRRRGGVHRRRAARRRVSRRSSSKDFLIDLVGYRRHGHNETDEPAFTQPKLYALDQGAPDAAPGVGRAARRAKASLTDEDVAGDRTRSSPTASRQMLRRDEERSARGRPRRARAAAPPPPRRRRRPAVRAEQLDALNEQLLAWPDGLQARTRGSRKTLERRREALGERAASTGGTPRRSRSRRCCSTGSSVRLTGQDAERGTFSHRHAVLHDVEHRRRRTRRSQHLPSATGAFEIYNSPLSETGGAGLRVRLQHRRAPTRWCCGRRSSATS